MGAKALRDVLQAVERTAQAGRLPICVFDLDSTLFSTAPRNLAILQEFIAAHRSSHPHLSDIGKRIGLDDMGWNVYQDLRRFGVEDVHLLERLKEFWFDRFFTDEYLLHDVPVRGAAEYVLACHARGALIYYLTGRHVGGMEIGTVRSLTLKGFPFWRGRCVLHLKPSFEMNDRAFKDDAVADIRSYNGEVVATFENEPGNANMFARAFPEATHVLLLTIASPEAEKPSPGLVLTNDFTLG
jgi:hypothetical protein